MSATRFANLDTSYALLSSPTDSRCSLTNDRRSFICEYIREYRRIMRWLECDKLVVSTALSTALSFLSDWVHFFLFNHSSYLKIVNAIGAQNAENNFQFNTFFKENLNIKRLSLKFTLILRVKDLYIYTILDWKLYFELNYMHISGLKSYTLSFTAILMCWY